MRSVLRMQQKPDIRRAQNDRPMKVFVYRSLKKNGYYLYVPVQDNFDKVPSDLKQALGKLEFSLDFELTSDRKLATESPEKVKSNLEQLGYHLQITDPWASIKLDDKRPATE